MKFFVTTVFVSLLAISTFSQNQKEQTKAAERVDRSAELLTQFQKLGENSLPMEILKDAKAVAVFPGVKKYSIMLSQLILGHGLVSMRVDDKWSTPVFLTLKGSDMNFKFADKESFDLVVILRTDKSIEALKKGKFIGTGALLLGPVVKGPGADTILRDAPAVYYPLSNGQLIDTDLKNNSVMGGFGLVHDNNMNKTIFHANGKTLLSNPEKAVTVPAEIEKFRTALTQILVTPSSAESVKKDGTNE